MTFLTAEGLHCTVGSLASVYWYDQYEVMRQLGHNLLSHVGENSSYAYKLVRPPICVFECSAAGHDNDCIRK